MALGKAIKGLVADWSAVFHKAFGGSFEGYFEGFWAKMVRAIFGLAFVVAIFSIPHFVWPKIDIKMLNTQMSRYDGRLTLVSFDLENGSYLDLKDPEVSCDMKGQSGTSIKTVSKVIYEVLPSERKLSFSDVEMGEIPEQVAYFSCHITSASVKW
jgi:hypothetical protein